MLSKKSRLDKDKMDQIIAETRRREKTYREQALKMYPWICARCGREFTGKKLRELTVHHKDHNHNNNPPDGSNWELLCLYCHDSISAQSRLSGPAVNFPLANSKYAKITIAQVEIFLHGSSKGRRKAVVSI